jgi:LytR cell envelope-related transcriptional attenuator
VAGVIVVAVGVVLLITSLGGSSSPSNTTSGNASSAARTRASHAGAHRHSPSKSGATVAGATNPAEASVAVLNGTETTGLAHRIAGVLQQRGYSQATALSGRPSGAGQTTVVEYASGHQAEAEAVARSLAVTSVQPIEEAVASLAGSAKVVVIVGADKAAASP